RDHEGLRLYSEEAQRLGQCPVMEASRLCPQRGIERVRLTEPCFPGPVVRDQCIVEGPATEALRSRRLHGGAGLAATGRQVCTREPPDAAEQRQRYCRALGRGQHLELRQSAIRKEHTSPIVVHVDEGLLRVGRHRRLQPASSLLRWCRITFRYAEMALRP